jgi:hypothetical protein
MIHLEKRTNQNSFDDKEFLCNWSLIALSPIREGFEFIGAQISMLEELARQRVLVLILLVTNP